MDDSRLEKVSILQKANNITFQDVVTNALDNYFSENVDYVEEQFKKIADDEILSTDYIYIPIKNYVAFNDISLRDVEVMIKQKKLMSLSLGQTQLIMIDSNLEAYKKIELMMIKNNVTNLTISQKSFKRELNQYKNEIAELKSVVEKLQKQ